MERYDEFVLRGDLKNVWFTFQIICFIMYASSSSWRWWTLMRCLSGPGHRAGTTGHRAGTLLTLTHANLGHNILWAGLESVSVICCIKYLCLMFYFPREFESFSVWPWFTEIVVGTRLTIINFIILCSEQTPHESRCLIFWLVGSLSWQHRWVLSDWLLPWLPVLILSSHWLIFSWQSSQTRTGQHRHDD